LENLSQQEFNDFVKEQFDQERFLTVLLDKKPRDAKKVEDHNMKVFD